MLDLANMTPEQREAYWREQAVAELDDRATLKAEIRAEMRAEDEKARRDAEPAKDPYTMICEKYNARRGTHA